MAFSYRIQTDSDGDLFIFVDGAEAKVDLWAFADGHIAWEFKNSFPVVEEDINA